MELGILTLLPPVAILLVAIKTRNTASSLFLGALICCILQYQTGFLTGFIDLMYAVGCDESTVWYVLFVSLFGCILGIWSRTGATRALAESLQKYATNQRRTLLLTWFIGLLMFIDDFASIAVRGTMTKLYDKNKIPRAMLSYITDAQAAPLNSLIPFGTWGIFYASVFVGYEEVSALGSGMDVYASTVPFMFYGWISLIISLMVAIGLIGPLGSMKKAYARARETGELYSPESAALNDGFDEEEPFDTKTMAKLLTGFIVPLVVFISVIVVTGDVIIGSIVAIVVTLVVFMALRLSKWTDLMKACMEGVADMVPMIVIVFAAYMVRDSLIAIGLPEYAISVAEPFMSPALLPVMTFVICALLAFLSGSNWGSTLPVAAVVIPLCAAIGGSTPLVLAAVVSGAAFGAHACFYCDVTIFTSGMTKIDNMEHATTQLPYCLIGAGATVVAFAIAGFVLV